MAEHINKTKSASRVHAKWGFGDAPLKPKHREQSEAAIRDLIAIFDRLPEADSCQLDSISHVKGLFSRVVKQDQWDWSTVWRLLGRPSQKPADKIAQGLAAFRLALKNSEHARAESIYKELREVGIDRFLKNFLDGPSELRSTGEAPGYIYILSTRDRPTLLKVGFTTRNVEKRVKEINSASGVIFPFGIRAVWEVDNSPQVESEIHAALADYRVRSDREFFELEFEEAKRLINCYLRNRRSNARIG